MFNLTLSAKEAEVLKQILIGKSQEIKNYDSEEPWANESIELMGKIILQLSPVGKLQWLILPDEDRARYTNWGDSQKNDASSRVAAFNADQKLKGAHSDWRLPSLSELMSLRSTPDAPTIGRFWCEENEGSCDSTAWAVDFGEGGGPRAYYRGGFYHVRLVRSSE